jgi:hypothetical protein
LLDGTYPKIPEDAGMPSVVVYGAKVELRLRSWESIPGGWEGIVHELYGPEMEVARISSTQLAYNAAMGRPVGIQ